MNVHHSFGSLAIAAALAAWVVAVAAQGPAPQAPGQPPGGNASPGQPAAAGQNASPRQPPAPGQNASPGQPAAGQNATPGAPGGAPPAPRPAVPAAASSIADHPDRFYGQIVTVYATVEQLLTGTAFTLDQDAKKSTGKEVIVLARRLHQQPELNAYVTVIGEVVKADAGEIAKIAKAAAAGLPAEVLAKHSGKPVVVATSVVTAALDDIAKFIPPPMTPEEASLDKAMKAVGGANGALRKGVEASNAELVKTNTAILAKAFAETEAFWKKRGKDDAVKMAQTARTAVDTIEKAAAMGNWNEAKAQNTTLGQQCQACHGAYRERLEDGTFAVKRDGQ